MHAKLIGCLGGVATVMGSFFVESIFPTGDWRWAVGAIVGLVLMAAVWAHKERDRIFRRFHFISDTEEAEQPPRKADGKFTDKQRELAAYAAFCILSYATLYVIIISDWWGRLPMILAMGVMIFLLLSPMGFLVLYNHISPAGRFRRLTPIIHSLRLSISEDNKKVMTVSNLRMLPKTTSEAKRLMYYLSKLGVPFPDGGRIDAWIDWLPHLQSLAEDGKLQKARNTNPYGKTLDKPEYRHALEDDDA